MAARGIGFFLGVEERPGHALAVAFAARLAGCDIVRLDTLVDHHGPGEGLALHLFTRIGNGHLFRLEPGVRIDQRLALADRVLHPAIGLLMVLRGVEAPGLARPVRVAGRFAGLPVVAVSGETRDVILGKSMPLIGCAARLHQRRGAQPAVDVGPGLLESVYETLLATRLQKQGLRVDRQVPVKARLDDIGFPDAFRADLLVEGKLLVELKSVEKLAPIHARQTLTYLRLLN